MELYDKVGDIVKNNDRFEHYELPDGHVITLGQDRFIVGESLFRPSLISVPPEGETFEKIKESIQLGFYQQTPKSSSELKDLKDLMKASVEAGGEEWKSQFQKSGRLIVTGGVSLLRGFIPRLQQEVLEAFGPGVKILARSDPKERRFSAWKGGRLLSEMSSMQKYLVTREEYDESGPSVANKWTF